MAAAVGLHRGRLLASALFAVISAACSLAPFLAVYAVTMALFVHDTPGDVPQIVAWTAAALLVRALTEALATHLGHVTAYRVLRDLRVGIARHLHELPLGRVQARSSGEMKKILHDDVEQVEEALAHGIPEGAAAAAVPLAMSVVLFVLDWRLALVALLALLLLVVVSAVGIAGAQKNNQQLTKHSSTIQRAVMSYLQGIAVVRGYSPSRAGRGGPRVDPAAESVVRGAELEVMATSGPLKWVVAAMGAATALAAALLLPASGFGYVAGRVDLGTLVLFLLLSLTYLTPIVSLVGTLATVLTRIQVSAATIDELLAEDPLPQSPAPQTPTCHDITFDAVGFGYRSNQDVLHGVELHVPDGTTLALVGPSGSGKSTLARLLARFYECGRGAVRIGGVDVRDIARKDLAQLVAFVQQDEYIFAASLRENIRIARPSATDAEVAEAAASAQLGDVVALLPGGLDSQLLAGGGNLSGGQRQRVAVARALVKDAPIIILDEATAALDAATERRTLTAIAQLTQGRTVIAIAHRLATIVDADAIAYLADGTVGATGTHPELLATHTPYRELWDAYTRATGWRPADAAPDAGSLRAEPVGAAPPSPTGLPPDAPEAPDATLGIERHGVGRMPFSRQWRTLYGRSWPVLVRAGLPRLFAESLARSAPLWAVLMAILAAIGALPGGRGLDSNLVWLLTTLLALALLVRVMTSVWTNSLVWPLAAAAKRDLRLSILRRLRRMPLGTFRRIDPGRAGGLITSEVPLLDFQNVPQQVIGSLVQPICAAVVLFVVDWRLAIATLIGLPLFWAVSVWGDRIYRQVFSDLSSARQRATSAMLEQSRGAAVLRGSPESTIARRYISAMDELAETSTAMSVRAAPATALGAVALESGQLALIAVGSWLFTGGAVDAVTLLLFLLLTLAIYQPIRELGALTGYRRNQQQIAARIGEVWDADILDEPDVGARPVGTDVELQAVTFCYDGSEAPALDRVTLRAPAGRITALVGPSGAGKSTIAHLLARLWDVDSGSVRIGGVDVRDLGSAGVFEAVSSVSQEVYLFPETVRFNLTMGREGISDSSLWEALRAAQCDDVVAGLPLGLDTVLADDGTDLSGGQRQRLAIARALTKNAPVLILDEAVAAVDPGTEDRLQSALSELVAGRTVLLVAHRIATIQQTAHIVVVDEGRIVGQGTHDELLHTCSTYCSLASEQSSDAPTAVATVPPSTTADGS